MAKKQQDKLTEATQQDKLTEVTQQEENKKIVEVETYETRPKPEPPKMRIVEKHRRCPLCFNKKGGVGVAYKTTHTSDGMPARYYKCNICAYRWLQRFSTLAVPTVDEMEKMNER